MRRDTHSGSDDRGFASDSVADGADGDLAQDGSDEQSVAYACGDVRLFWNNVCGKRNDQCDEREARTRKSGGQRQTHGISGTVTFGVQGIRHCHEIVLVSICAKINERQSQ